MLYLELFDTGIRYKKSPGGNQPFFELIAWGSIRFEDAILKDAAWVYASEFLLTFL